MTVDRHIPTELLQPFIKAYLLIECDNEVVNRVLPDTSLVMAFRYKGHVSSIANNAETDVPFSVVSGLRRSGRFINYAKGTGNILVLWKETGAAAFLKEPLHEFFDNSIALGNCSGYHNLSIVEEQIAEAPNNVRRIEIIEEFLLSMLFNNKPDTLITTAIEKIYKTKGTMKIKDLASTLYSSQDVFEKRFRRIVGASPKQFSSIVRLQSIVRSGQQNRTLTDVALDAGYFDQAHFSKDFKVFTGQSPVDFFKAPLFW